MNYNVLTIITKNVLLHACTYILVYLEILNKSFFLNIKLALFNYKIFASISMETELEKKHQFYILRTYMSTLLSLSYHRNLHIVGVTFYVFHFMITANLRVSDTVKRMNYNTIVYIFHMPWLSPE